MGIGRGSEGVVGLCTNILPWPPARWWGNKGAGSAEPVTSSWPSPHPPLCIRCKMEVQMKGAKWRCR